MTYTLGLGLEVSLEMAVDRNIVALVGTFFLAMGSASSDMPRNSCKQALEAPGGPSEASAEDVRQEPSALLRQIICISYMYIQHVRIYIYILITMIYVDLDKDSVGLLVRPKCP